MRYFRVSAAMLALAFATNAGAQNLKDELQTYLADQWREAMGATACLEALRLYIATHDTSAALPALKAGQPDAMKAMKYDLASKRFPDFWTLVASAVPAPLRTFPGMYPDADAMFAEADKLITGVYNDDAAALSQVGTDFDAKNYMQALYGLLDGVGLRKDIQKAKQPNAADYQKIDNDLIVNDLGKMQLVRACYAVSPDRLFKLVNKHFNK